MPTVKRGEEKGTTSGGKEPLYLRFLTLGLCYTMQKGKCMID
ncbi:MAG: hypothetical protein ACXW3E_11435 [Thermoanaerobaculia bacterium]